VNNTSIPSCRIYMFSGPQNGVQSTELGTRLAIKDWETTLVIGTPK
jgi:hypothetical protein